MHKFYENTIESKFINALLSSSYIPTLQVVKQGDKLIKDQTYIARDKVIKCSKTGIFGFESEDAEETELKRAGFKVVNDYTWGMYYPKYTETFIPKSDYYDNDTHEYLCKYLSAYSSYYELNLMGYCNLYANKYIPNIKIEEDSIYS